MASSALISLLGDSLFKDSKTKVSTSQALQGKQRIGIYFSAHWCPPCRGFTPVLAQKYKEYVGAGKDFEIVFVSSDRDQTAFDDYFSEMPWLAMPFSERTLKNELSSKFGVRGIPTLVILDADGSTITTEGRSAVMNDSIPWPALSAPSTPPSSSPLTELIGQTFLAPDGKTTVGPDALAGAELVGLYFSAHWCGPCRSFTPKLADFYATLQQQGKPFPIIFGSSDRTEAEFHEYFSEMPWLAFPHQDARIEALKRKYSVSGIPWLVVLDKRGRLILNEADAEVVSKGPVAYDGWLSQATGRSSVPAVPAARPASGFEAVIGTEFLRNDGETVEYSELEGKVIGLYFSAHWCPPCRGFTPALVKTYRALQAQGRQFEIIFVSADQSMAAFRDYFGSMPWLAIPQGDSRCNQLSQRYGVSGIPALVLLDEQRDLISQEGRAAVSADPEGLKFPWAPLSPTSSERRTAQCVVGNMSTEPSRRRSLIGGMGRRASKDSSGKGGKDSARARKPSAARRLSGMFTSLPKAKPVPVA